MLIHKGYGGVSIGYDRESVLEGQINGSYVHKSVHTFDMNKVIVWGIIFGIHIIINM